MATMSLPLGKPAHLRATGTSLANVWEIISALLNAVAARSVMEVGAFRGELTRDLLDWGADAAAQVIAVDPAPPDELVELAVAHPTLKLIRETSFEALEHSSMPDVVIIDGDHNYYTVTGELQRISGSAPGVSAPLVLFHDVGWPLARRDTYHVPEQIPNEFRQPLLPTKGLSPEPNFADDRPFAHTAEREGGPRNGGLTAIEDFIEQNPGLRLAVVPAFFGFGVLWHVDAPWAAAVAEIVAPFDRHPVLERLEADRVAHLLAEQGQSRVLRTMQEHIDRLQQQVEDQDRAMRDVFTSNAYKLALVLARASQQVRAIFSRRAGG
jgi:hypothetical protein